MKPIVCSKKEMKDYLLHELTPEDIVRVALEHAIQGWKEIVTLNLTHLGEDKWELDICHYEITNNTGLILDPGEIVAYELNNGYFDFNKDDLFDDSELKKFERKTGKSWLEVDDIEILKTLYNYPDEEAEAELFDRYSEVAAYYYEDEFVEIIEKACKILDQQDVLEELKKKAIEIEKLEVEDIVTKYDADEKTAEKVIDILSIFSERTKEIETVNELLKGYRREDSIKYVYDFVIGYYQLVKSMEPILRKIFPDWKIKVQPEWQVVIISFGEI